MLCLLRINFHIKLLVWKCKHISHVTEFENDDNSSTNIDMLGIPLGEGGTTPLSDDQMSEDVDVLHICSIHINVLNLCG